MPTDFLSGVGGIPGSGGISLYFRYLALQKIVGIAERTNYSHYIVTRSDYNYTIPHPQVLLDNALMVPYGEDYDGLCDRHMVIPRQFAVQTLSILYALGKGYDPKLEWWRNRIETLLDAWTKELKLEVRPDDVFCSGKYE